MAFGFGPFGGAAFASLDLSYATATVTGVPSSGVVHTSVGNGNGTAIVTGSTGSGILTSVTPFATTIIVVTGVASTGTVNSAIGQGDGNRTVTGVSGTGSLNSVTPFATTIIVVTGVASTGTVNSVTPLGIARIIVTGVVGSGLVNTVTINSDTTFSVTGISGIGTLNSVIPLGISIRVVTGVSTLGLLGATTATGTGNISITGVMGTSIINSVIVNASSAVIIGSSITSAGSVHTPTAIVGAFSSPTGIGGTGIAGTLNATGDGNAVVIGVVAIGIINSAFARNYVNAIVYVSTVTATGINIAPNTYIIDPVDADGAGGVPVYTGVPLALVGDYVGTATIPQLTDPINATITYRNIPLALETAIIPAHVGPAHPAVTIVSTLPTGSPDALVSNIYRLIRVGDIASCGDLVTLNPALVDPTIRVAEIHERGRTAIP